MKLEVVREGEGFLKCLGDEKDFDDDVKLAPSCFGDFKGSLFNGCLKRAGT